MARRRTIRSLSWSVPSAGPFTATFAAASNLSVGSGAVVIFSSLTHLTTSARFRARASSPVSGRLYGAASWRGWRSCPGFPLRFRRRHSLLGHPIPAGGLGLPDGRLTGPKAGPRTGLPRSARTSYERGGRPLYPEDGGAHPGQVVSLPGACRSAAASPSARSSIPSCGALLDEASTRVQAIRPSALPLACSSRMEREPLGFPLELRTPPLPAAHVEGGARPSSTNLEQRSMTSATPPILRVHSMRATSRRTTKGSSPRGGLPRPARDGSFSSHASVPEPPIEALSASASPRSIGLGATPRPPDRLWIRASGRRGRGR